MYVIKQAYYLWLIGLHLLGLYLCEHTVTVSETTEPSLSGGNGIVLTKTSCIMNTSEHQAQANKRDHGLIKDKSNILLKIQ